mmetsp:Transcript_2165/g.4558  ORF Transcript_2165/g.4558 Transcript_2165/m.4558 type:complete len:414 (-) Transcript_2165:447-1688(-)
MIVLLLLLLLLLHLLLVVQCSSEGSTIVLRLGIVFLSWLGRILGLSFHNNFRFWFFFFHLLFFFGFFLFLLLGIFHFFIDTIRIVILLFFIAMAFHTAAINMQIGMSHMLGRVGRLLFAGRGVFCIIPNPQSFVAIVGISLARPSFAQTPLDSQGFHSLNSFRRQKGTSFGLSLVRAAGFNHIVGLALSRQPNAQLTVRLRHIGVSMFGLEFDQILKVFFPRQLLRRRPSFPRRGVGGSFGRTGAGSVGRSTLGRRLGGTFGCTAHGHARGGGSNVNPQGIFQEFIIFLPDLKLLIIHGPLFAIESFRGRNVGALASGVEVFIVFEFQIFQKDTGFPFDRLFVGCHFGRCRGRRRPAGNGRSIVGRIVGNTHNGWIMRGRRGGQFAFVILFQGLCARHLYRSLVLNAILGQPH